MKLLWRSGIYSKYLHGVSQSPITPIPGDLKVLLISVCVGAGMEWGSSMYVARARTHTHTHTHTRTAHAHTRTHIHTQICTYKKCFLFSKWWKERTQKSYLLTYTHIYTEINLGVGGCVSLFSPSYLRTGWPQIHPNPNPNPKC